MTHPIVVVVECSKCEHVFYPYGRMPVIPPVREKYKCPRCKYVNDRLFDDQLIREITRKELGLDRNLNEKLKQLELENKGLRTELVSLKGNVEANGKAITELRDYVDSLVLQTRKEVADFIAKEKIARAKAKTSSKYRV